MFIFFARGFNKVFGLILERIYLGVISDRDRFPL